MSGLRRSHKITELVADFVMIIMILVFTIRETEKVTGWRRLPFNFKKENTMPGMCC